MSIFCITNQIFLDSNFLFIVTVDGGIKVFVLVRSESFWLVTSVE